MRAGQRMVVGTTMAVAFAAAFAAGRSGEQRAVAAAGQARVIELAGAPALPAIERGARPPALVVEPPVVRPPADRPHTDPPATEPPRTDPPTTEPPTTDPPKTDPPKTDPPDKIIIEEGGGEE